MSARKDKTVLLVLLRKLCCFVTKRVLFVKESDYSRQNQSFMFGNSAKSISISIDCARAKICMALQNAQEGNSSLVSKSPEGKGISKRDFLTYGKRRHV